MPVTFAPLPDIKYRFDYEKFFGRVARNEIPEEEKRALYRHFILNDLWFVVFAVMAIEKANHPFVLKMCDMVQDGPKTGTLDVWARFHYKSCIITQAETLQHHLRYPEQCTGIFSYVRPLAKAFLRSVKVLLESSELLKWCFPDVVWANPAAEAPKWSEDEGLVLKRQGNARKESTIEAWGLVEGMPIGRHFERMVFDDVETHDIADSPEMLEKVYSKFEMAQNLGTGMDSDIVRVIGTYYSHFGPIKRIGDLKWPSDGTDMFRLRVVPGSDDGTRSGEPVLMEPKTWEKLKTSQHFNSQQLCDPTPTTDMKLDPKFIRYVDAEKIPKNLLRFLIVDPAGDAATNVKKGDAWAIELWGIEPTEDELGQCSRYLLDAVIEPLDEASAVSLIARMYMNGGLVVKFGYEKFGNFTPAVAQQVIDMLRQQRRIVGEEYGNFTWLKHAGRNKKSKILNALQWPLLNGKIHVSSKVGKPVRDRLEQEMLKFPFWHDDGLDGASYLDDILADPDIRFMVHTSDRWDAEDGTADGYVDYQGRSAVGGY